MTRIPALRSFYDNRLGLVTLSDDVLGVVEQVRELYDGKVWVELDEGTGAYHFVEKCEDGTERLIFTTDALDGRALTRLREADSTYRFHEDPYAKAEREQDELQAAIDKKHSEALLEIGEEFAFEMRRAGKAPHFPVPVAIPRDVNA
jgi:hypothetical protein